MPLPSGSDYDLDPGLSGLLLRQELNTILLALLTMNASGSLPPQTFAFMQRVDSSASPNEIQIRNPADSAFLKLAEITDTQISLFSQGAAVPSLGAAQTFTQSQTIDTQGSASLLSIGSDLSAGVVARIPMFGHNSNGTDVTGVNLVCRINTNTAGAEDFSFEVEVVRGSSTTTVATLGSLADFKRSGGGGIIDADTIRQAGIDLATIINTETSRLGTSGNFNVATGRALTQADAGRLLRFNGSSNQTFTVPRLSQNTAVFFVNDSGGAGNVTFQSDISPNDVNFRTSRLTLPGISGQSPMCALVWFQSDGARVNIVGNNT